MMTALSRNVASRVATARGTASRRILGCVSNARARRRLELALRGHARLEWFASFAAVRAAIEAERRVCTVITGMSDDSGETAAEFARSVRVAGKGAAIVACCDIDGTGMHSVSELAIAGVHDVLFTGFNDDAHSARTIIFGAILGGAGDVVHWAAAPLIPVAMMRFVEMAARRPRDLRRVAEVAEALGVSRQTLGRWCRVHKFIGPEELLVWVRLLLVAALLEATDLTLEAIAYDMQYGSPTALRNRIREYTALKATDLREGGLRIMLDAFRRRIDAVRRHWPDVTANPRSAGGR
jgi:AraC-like DNA-binding protein